MRPDVSPNPAASSLGSANAGGEAGSSPQKACGPWAGKGARLLNVIVSLQLVPSGARKANVGGPPNSAVS